MQITKNNKNTLDSVLFIANDYGHKIDEEGIEAPAYLKCSYVTQPYCCEILN